MTPRVRSDKLKGTFAETLRRQAIDAIELARDARGDPDLRDAVLAMLTRITDTARSLGLEPILDAAEAAAAAIAAGGGGTDSLETLLEQCRGLDGIAPVLRPVIVVAATAGTELRLRAQAEAMAVPVEVVVSSAEALRRVRGSPPAALVVPAADLEACLGGDVGSVPVYVYGDGADLRARVLAARRGAAGFLPEPLDLREAIPRIRQRLTALAPGVRRALLVDGRGGGAFAALIAGKDLEVTVITRPALLLVALDEAVPDLVILSLALDGVAATDLVAVLRGHHRYGDVPRALLVDDAESERRALNTDVDAVIRRDGDPEQLRGRTRALLDRAWRERQLRVVDLTTGVLSRGALLRAADREIAAARRNSGMLAVLRIDLAVPRGEPPRSLEPAVRSLARVLEQELRETDVVGHLGSSGFAVLLPACSAEHVRARIPAIRERFARHVRDNPRLATAVVSMGVADSAAGIDDVMVRADQDLTRARAR